MVTVYEQLSLYCQARALPAPTKAELTDVGNIISHHFRKYWGPKQFLLPGLIIPDTGFKLQEEADGKHVVAGYPDIFKEEMHIRFDIYFEGKGIKKPVIKEKKAAKPGATLAYKAKPEGKK